MLHSRSPRAEHETPAGEQNLHGAHILLVEDNDINAYVAKTILEDFSCQVDVAGNGKQAVSRFEQSVQGHYGAILMDVHMPEMDG